jgi:molybdate transport repressor ModE-like protein
MRNADGWEALEVRHLRAFLLIARHGSFSGAARELGYTQSAVSQQLLALERIVGAPLFTRPLGGRRPVELTEAGDALFAHAEALLARTRAARADLDAIVAGERGTVRIATIQSVGARLLPKVLADFRAAHPAVNVEIQEARTIKQLADAVESGTVEVGFAALPTPAGPFLTHELLSDPYVLVTPAARMDVRSLRDVHARRLLGIRGCKNEPLIEQYLLAEGIVPATIERFDDNALIQALVAAGEGVAIVPHLGIDPADDRIAIQPVPELPPRQLTVITHSERRLALATTRFIETAGRVCGKHGNRVRPARRHAA